MIIILSNSLAKRWKLKPVPLHDVPSCHPALVWRADWFQIAQMRSNIICVNEDSLFSFVLLDQKQMAFKKTMLNIINRIGDCLLHAGVAEQRIRQGISEVFFVKHPNPQIIGTMTDQKLRYEWDCVDPHPRITSFDEFERRNNDCPLNMFDMKSSAEMFVKTVKKKWPIGSPCPELYR